jgi:hypothetical protein
MSWQRLDEFGGIQDQVRWTCLVLSITKDFRFGKLRNLNDETLPIVENQNTQKGGIQGTKWKDMSQKTNEPPK